MSIHNSVGHLPGQTMNAYMCSEDDIIEALAKAYMRSEDDITEALTF